MSDIRDKARKILDLALPTGKVITSDGATAGQYARMTKTTGRSMAIYSDTRHSTSMSRSISMTRSCLGPPEARVAKALVTT